MPGTESKVIAESQSLPDYVSGALQHAIERAIRLSREEYTPYPHQRIARHPTEHHRARALTNQMVGSTAHYANRAQELAALANQSFNNGQPYQEYMAPYQHSVVDELERLGRGNFSANIMPELESRFAAKVGHSRHPGFREEVNRDMGREFQAHREDAMSRGHGIAMDMFDMDRTRELEAANLMSKLGLKDQGAQISDIETLQRIAEIEREKEQQQLNLQHELWKERQRHEHERLEELFRFLSGAPKTPSSLQKTTETQAPSTTMHSGDWRDMAQGAAMSIAGGLLSGGSETAAAPTRVPTLPDVRFQRIHGFWPWEQQG